MHTKPVHISFIKKALLSLVLFVGLVFGFVGGVFVVVGLIYLICY